MTKTDFISHLAQRMETSEADAERCLDHCLEALKNLLIQGDHLTLPGFGRFAVVEKKERIGRNPQTGKPLTIAAQRVPVFKPGDALKLHVRNQVPSLKIIPNPKATPKSK